MRKSGQDPRSAYFSRGCSGGLDRGYANFLERREGEVRRIHIPRGWVNKGKKKGRSSWHLRPVDRILAYIVRRLPRYASADLPKMLFGLFVVLVHEVTREGMLLAVVAALTLSEHRRRESHHHRRREHHCPLKNRKPAPHALRPPSPAPASGLVYRKDNVSGRSESATNMLELLRTP